jgi:hypothetical protein
MKESVNLGPDKRSRTFLTYIFIVFYTNLLYMLSRKNINISRNAMVHHAIGYRL